MSDPFDISIRANVKEISKRLSDFAYKQINYATALALTELAKEVRDDEVANIAATFKKPKPFTQKAVGMRGARKDTLTATVFVRPIAARYLQPYETGGNHVLPGKALLNPKDIKLNAYGQLPKGVMARLKARADIFIGPVKTKGGMVDGVWQRMPAVKASAGSRRGPARAAVASHLKLLIRFGDAVPVKKSLNYRSRARSIVDRRFNNIMSACLAKAMATAK